MAGTSSFRALSLLLVMALAAPALGQMPPGTAWTYQGRLEDGGTPLDGTADFELALYDAVSSGTLVAGPITVSNVAVVDGLFTVELDFGGVFAHQALFLDVSVRAPHDPSDTALYTALTPRQPVTPAPIALALPYLRTETTTGGPNVIGGEASNSVVGGATTATISGGRDNTAGQDATVSGGTDNDASGGVSTIAGGRFNDANGDFSSVGGGWFNVTSADYTTIAGGGPSDPAGDPTGTNNRVYDGYGVIGGGARNRAGSDDGDSANAVCATVSGGVGNTASGIICTVGGGSLNTASSFNSTVGGGQTNTASGSFSTVGGGLGNTASGDSSTVPGGYQNTASGDFSMAAGHSATASGTGTFVWNDNSGTVLNETANNRVTMRAIGGFKFFTSATGGAILFSGSGSWSSFSDRSAKENFADVDAVDVLDKVAALPITSWNYIAQGKDVRHIGPMAQDFHSAFGFGPQDTHITAVDADGVALAAIQGLHSIVEEKDCRINELETRLARIEAMLDRAGQGGDK